MSKGIYLYPESNRFVSIIPSVDDIVMAIAERDIIILYTPQDTVNRNAAKA